MEDCLVDVFKKICLDNKIVDLEDFDQTSSKTDLT